MSTREAVLSRVRKSLGAGADDAARRERVTARLKSHPTGVIPARGHLPPKERVALFSAMAVRANATVAFVDSYGDVPKAVTAYLRDRNLPAEIRMGNDPRLAAAPFAEEKTLRVRTGASDGNDLVGVSHALGGIAESGTLALTSGAENPTTVNFLPEHHIVVLDAHDVAGDLEALWQALRTIRGGKDMPRTVNLITGPSRSGDIEQVLLLGAHGPRALHILIVDRQ